MPKFNPYSHLGFLTNRVGRLLAKRMRMTIDELGYTPPISCIGILADLWSKDGVMQKDLGSSLIKTKSSINKMLEALEKEGLIVKKDNPEDKRGKLIFLTSEGKKLQASIEKHVDSCEELIKNKVSEKDLATTKKVLAQYYELLINETKARSNN